MARNAPRNALEREFFETRTRSNVRSVGRVSSRSVVDKTHDIVTVSAIVDSSYPGWVWGACEGGDGGCRGHEPGNMLSLPWSSGQKRKATEH
jgi:hypothetical protein